MKVKQWFSFCALLCSILLLSACGSNSGSGGDQSAGPAEGDLGTDTAGIKYVGSAKCIGCHDDFSWSTEIVDAYLMGKHVIHSDHITAADKVNGCLVCHDPIGDGPLLEAFIDAANVPTEGLAAIGCEACHGAGGDHYGIGPMPIAKPGIDACAQCHDKLPEGHLVHHPEADMISSNFVESRHFTASVRNGAVCSKCHTDVGGRLYKGVSTKTQLMASVMAVDSTEPVQCKTCHDPHHAGGLLMEASRNSSSEYETCITCHMSDRDDPADDEWMYHENVYYRIITDTHYDDPATPDVIEGYAISKLNDRACRDCHDVHTVKEIQKNTNTINDQWAKSRHAGEIGIVKKEKAEEYAAADMDRTIEQTVAIKEAGVLGDESSWPYYDWDAENRQGCQKCHTATGFANYADNPETYDAANNDFSHLAGWSKDAAGTVISSGQNEMLYCWGCHSNNSGALRVEGAVTTEYELGGKAVVLPDSGDSNTCYVCHAGRGNNETASTGSRFAGHHAPAAATLFNELTNVAYEYPGQNYSNVPYFAHDSLDLGGDGPCVACHMNGEKNDHTFAVVNKDSDGEITSIRSENCVSCHGGEHALFVSENQIGETHDLWNGTALVPTVVSQSHVDEAAAELVHEAEGYQEAGRLLNDLINNANGLTNYTGAVINQNNSSDNDRGAFQNAKLTSEEKGGYAHNRYYVKRALFDAIDWAEDGSIDGTINDYSTDYPLASGWLGTERP